MRHLIDPIVIGMPQLGPYGLSENWLLRYVGDLHWRIICQALRVRSRDIVDRAGCRLYASFIRVTWQASAALSNFAESDELSGSVEMSRCGDGIFLSQTALKSGARTIDLRMASVFSRRENAQSNNRLLPSTPILPRGFSIPNTEALPQFVVDHRLVRTGQADGHPFCGLVFNSNASDAERIPYQLNGFHEFNGANLLYFAAYPTIADTCISHTHHCAETVGFERFVTQCSPLGRDTFYFANANLTSTLECVVIPQNCTAHRAYLVDMIRSDDNVLMSRQFVVREARDFTTESS